ncbi:SpoIIE family protein phosphatase [Streptomyces niger]|uniref:SpoIIE family protein phosphatase n=1 Tax=Streptomyces niger TaxID=66373 RepID=UPI00069A48F5|nr:SpoIIE family protein phosphatase [Streptomyces niger]
MGDSSQPGSVQSQTFPPRPESVAHARRFVRRVLAGIDCEAVDSEVAENAALLVSELVTNAVLHAGTAIEVTVRILDHKVRTEVGDRRPHRGLVPQGHFPHATSGRGLRIVEQLASRYGVDTGEDSKTVWYELWLDGGQPPPSRWRSEVPASSPTRTVSLVDLPGALYVASQQHCHSLLRELTLAASTGQRSGVRPADLAVAHDVNNVISACVTAEWEWEQQPPAAHFRTVRLPFPADAGPAVLTLRRVLDAAEEAARGERLLSLPALPQNSALSHWLLDQLSGQLAGGPPTAWTVMPREPSASPLEPAVWEAGQVTASGIPTIAADDENRIIAANGSAADMLGWQADDLIGRRLTTLIPEHLRRRHVAAFSSLLLTGRPRILGRSVPIPALHRDGRLVPVRLFIQTQETADGRPVFVAQLTPRTVIPAASPGPSEEGSDAVAEAPGGVQEAGEAQQPGELRAEPDDDEATGSVRERRLLLLADIRDALSAAADLKEGVQRVCAILSQRLAGWCVVDLLSDSGQLERVCVTHRGPGPLPAEVDTGKLPVLTENARGPLGRVLRGAGPLLLSEAPPPHQSGTLLDTHYVELFERMGARSAVVAPLRARGAVFGALTLARSAAEPPFTEEDLPQVADLVRNLALGVEHARLYQESRQIAERLQRSLLPVLPDLPYLRLAARYAPSSTAAQVGGDWFDGFVLPNGNTAVVIGDVAGHDLDAAVAMSQLRSMLRGIAVDRQEPPQEVLRRLDLANHSLYREATATCVYGVVEGPEDGPWRLRYSSAGHLPPLLTTREGDTSYLEDGMGLLLGMDPDMPRPGAEAPLPPHSTVLLYTDGLVERRDESLDVSLSRLRRLTAALAREPLDVFCDELLIGLSADSVDDIALLAVRPVPAPDR